LCEDVAVDAAEGVGAEAIAEDAVSASGFVGDGDVTRPRILEESDGEEICPAIVVVSFRAAAVGDAVADDDDTRGGGGGKDFEGGDEVPVRGAGGRWIREVCIGDVIAMGEEAGGAAAGVGSYIISLLPTVKVHRDRYSCASLDFEINGIGDG